MLMTFAVIGGGAAAVLGLVLPSAAQTPTQVPFSTPAGTVSTATMVVGGAGPTYSGSTSNTAGAPDTGRITLQSPRTVLDMQSFNIAAEDTLNFEFASADWIVVIRTSSGSTIDGIVNATIGTRNA
ncbi:MAG TPA: hypothetical protein VNT52_18590, partial [Acidimicrobiales bacterium]|nr:hypothetical protein [Acidimicrobiales bacterium]